jgi:polar amino acid transport system substrate-binding protein
MSAVRLPLMFALALAFALAGHARAQPVPESFAKEGKLTMAFVNAKPWAYRDASGTLRGLEVDIVQAALGPSGLKTIDPVSTEFASIIPGLQSKRFDMSNGGMFITPQRCKMVAFSDPYLKLADGLIVKAGNPLKIKSYKDFVERPSLRLGTLRGNTNALNAELAGVPMSRQLLLPDPPSLISALLGDRLDAVSLSVGTLVALLTDPNLKGLERAIPFTGYVDPATGQEKIGYSAFAFRPDETGLKKLFDDALARMERDGTLERILATYGFSAADLPIGVTSEAVCNG